MMLQRRGENWNMSLLLPWQLRYRVINRVHSTFAKQPVILLQKVMVSPGTRLVKNRESQYTTNESQFKKNRETYLSLYVTWQLI